MKKKCIICGNNFFTKINKKTCSDDCNKKYVYKRDNIEIICQVCGRKCIINKRNKHKVCSYECRKKLEYGQNENICIICGKKFKSSWKKTCSKTCRKKNYKKNNTKILKCVICNKEFIVPKNSRKTTCSKNCQRKKLFNDNKVKRQCIICGNYFYSYRKKICSYECEKTYNKTINLKKIKCVICNKEAFVPKISKRKTCSKECKNKLNGLLNKGNKFNLSDSAKKKISIGRKRFLSKKENLEKLSEYTRLSWLNESVRKKRIETKNKRILSGEIKFTNNYKKSKKKFKYNNINFRSSWEVKVAKWLDDNNIKWEYETKKCRIKRPNNHVYICDFYLPELNKFLEVKGWWNQDSINKCDELVFKLGFDKLLIVDKKNIKNISLNNLWSEQSKLCFKHEEIFLETLNEGLQYANY